MVESSRAPTSRATRESAGVSAVSPRERGEAGYALGVRFSGSHKAP